MASLATGVGMTRISAQELFDHQERTSTQILTIALPIFARFAFRRDLFTVGRLNRDEEDEQARDWGSICFREALGSTFWDHFQNLKQSCQSWHSFPPKRYIIVFKS
jgi:hypothetical protein